MSGVILDKAPQIPAKGLFEFCPQDYWRSLDSVQLARWIHALSSYIDEVIRATIVLDLEEEEVEGLSARFGVILDELQIDLSGSGHVWEYFHGKNFEIEHFFEFLNWGSRQLLWLFRSIIWEK
ncbi:MAG: hypothetical protein AB4352_21215 [Hormoscilla sp.]